MKSKSIVAFAFVCVVAVAGCGSTTGLGTNCPVGSAPAINDDSVCCSLDHPWYTADGSCAVCQAGYSQALNDASVCCPTPESRVDEAGVCRFCPTGYTRAVNDLTCCPDGSPWFGLDGYCHANESEASCLLGLSPAVNDPTKCCPDEHPWYGANGLCHELNGGCPPDGGPDPDPDQPWVGCCPVEYPWVGGVGGGCSMCSLGYTPAVNDSTKCCSDGYPWYGADGFCHASEECRSNGECDDGLRCNGTERCEGGVCVAGFPPVCGVGQLCGEVDPECYYPNGCNSDEECGDGVFCNGAERCLAGTCFLASVPPCPEGCSELMGCFQFGSDTSCFPNRVAVNNSLVCCPVGYPWYDGYDGCHKASLLADDGTFLGEIDDNPFNADSIANRFGTFGNTFSAISIWNEFGTYGSNFGLLSPWSFTATPPSVLLGDGTFAGYLTAGFMVPSIHPNDLAVAIGREDVVR